MIYKKLFIASTVASVIASFSIIGMGIYEMILDQDEMRIRNKADGFLMTHIFISLLIYISANVIILIHVAYITQYVLRGFRYHWKISWHYFFYVLLEIIAIVCVVGKYEYLAYPLVLQLLAGVLFVCLFFFNCWAVEIFNDIENNIKRAEGGKKVRVKFYKDRKSPCVRIDLHALNLQAGPSTSRH